MRWLRQRPHGVVTIEFALVALVFFPLLLGIMEFGRLFYTLNAAAEATRLGARLAAVCSPADVSKIKERMRFLIGGVSPDQISISYLPDSACDPVWSSASASRCESVTVELSGASFRPLIPYFGSPISMPPFTTTLPRELMDSTGNPACF